LENGGVIPKFVLEIMILFSMLVRNTYTITAEYKKSQAIADYLHKQGKGNKN